ncbi:phage regulatory CII family protein [Acidovorax sp. K2F]|uniref:phage regulatory CII family protein n=1 Tax=Acidovorax sp. K2F TaxID=2978125 RepID=UPI0021B0935D|nr:phage regulatory CII family protein [Acidovorax sp. K2F]MCT6721644.1 transcriptional regulator [Acidovorax sp. K2F]
MSLFDTLRRAADHFPGGRSTISHRNGWNDEYTRKQLSGSASHKLGAMDALAIARLCIEAGTEHCFDYPAYVAEECGGKFVLDAQSPEPEQSPMRRVSVLAREAGDVTAVFLDALQDGKISDNELADIELEIAQAEEALRKLRQAARAVNAAGKPGAVQTQSTQQWVREFDGAPA